MIKDNPSRLVNPGFALILEEIFGITFGQTN